MALPERGGREGHPGKAVVEGKWLESRLEWLQSGEHRRSWEGRGVLGIKEVGGR